MRTLSNNVLSFLKHSVSELGAIPDKGFMEHKELVEKLESFKKETLLKYGELKTDFEAKAEEHHLSLIEIKTKLDILERELATEKPLKAEDVELQQHKLLGILHSIQKLMESTWQIGL